jgi:Na+-transporting NADH:ubiquinone oxidoreductase subunit NqrC
LNITATAASAAAAASATIATAIAAAMATTVATTVATVAMMASTVAAAVAATMAAAASAAAAAKDEGRSLLLTAHQGDSNQGEKHRQSKHNNSVHPRILQLLTGTVSGKYQVAVSQRSQRGGRRHQRRDATCLSDDATSIHPKRSLLSKSTGCEECSGHKG